MLGKTRIIQIGNSVGIVLPKEALSALHADKGDTLIVSAEPGGLKLTAYDDEKSRQIELVRKIMRRRRHALRELAK
jgi:putative addiction module antidote